MEGNGWLDPAPESKVGDSQFRIVRIRTAIADNICNTNDCRLSHAMIDEHAISRFHVANRTKSLWIPDAIPDGLAFLFQLFKRVRVRVRFCQKKSTPRW